MPVRTRKLIKVRADFFQWKHWKPEESDTMPSSQPTLVSITIGGRTFHAINSLKYYIQQAKPKELFEWKKF